MVMVLEAGGEVASTPSVPFGGKLYAFPSTFRN